LNKLQGQVAIVTGGSRGIGKAIVKELARNGARVIINYHESERDCTTTVEEFHNEGLEVNSFAADVSNPVMVMKLVEFTKECYGPVSILVNNAGIVCDRTIRKMTLDEWKRVIDVNLTGAFLCTKFASEQMISEEQGRIVNIASIVAKTGNFGQANYCASKAGLIGLTMTSAIEFAKYGINVNGVAPGFIKTKMTESMPNGALESVVGRTPLKVLGSPQDVSNAVLFLVSEESKFITGQIIDVNGGLLMG
jgi:NAD(P)-dependent dehydrogenase (short-subunit alcohol dehydrogenase family)